LPKRERGSAALAGQAGASGGRHRASIAVAGAVRQR